MRKQRNKKKTFAEHLEDLKRFKEEHGHVKVTKLHDKALAAFCSRVRCTRKKVGNDMTLTDATIAEFDSLGFDWTCMDYIKKTFDQRIADLEEYKRTHGHVNVTPTEDFSLGHFCLNIRYARKVTIKAGGVGKAKGVRKVTDERVAWLDALGFQWNVGAEAQTYTTEVTGFI